MLVKIVILSYPPLFGAPIGDWGKPGGISLRFLASEN